jgi:hypothetical protein
MDKNQEHQLDPTMEELKNLKQTIRFLEDRNHRIERVYQERIVQLQEINGSLSQVLNQLKEKYEKGNNDSVTGDAGISDH